MSDMHRQERVKMATSRSPPALAPALLSGTLSGCRGPIRAQGSVALSAIVDSLHNRMPDGRHWQAELADLEALLLQCDDILDARRLLRTMMDTVCLVYS